MTYDRLLRRVICGFLHLWIVLTSVVSGQSAYEPGFLGPLKNVTVVQGKDASFTCMVDNLGVHRIAWIKVDTKAILAIHDNVITNNARLSVTMNDKLTWTLHLKNVQPSDAGRYMCQLNSEPMRKQMAYLEVVIPPDIISEETSGDVMVPEGGNAKLICRAKGYPKPIITWRKEDGNPIIIKEHNGHGGKRKVKAFEGEVLNLLKIVRSEMGAYLCIASNGVPPSVSKSSSYDSSSQSDGSSPQRIQYYARMCVGGNAKKYLILDVAERHPRQKSWSGVKALVSGFLSVECASPSAASEATNRARPKISLSSSGWCG